MNDPTVNVTVVENPHDHALQLHGSHAGTAPRSTTITSPSILIYALRRAAEAGDKIEGVINITVR